MTDRTVAACIAGGAGTVREVAERCGAGGRCGGCIPVVEEMLSAVAVALPARRDTVAA